MQLSKNNYDVMSPSKIVFVCLILFSTLSAGTFSAEPSNLAISSDDFHYSTPAKEELGKMLFFDKILSGNRNMSCATCHHPFTGTSDNWALPIGEGGRGLGLSRSLGIGSEAVHERVPRNSPALFNLGATEFVMMFHDGRVMVDATQPSGFLSPAGDNLPMGLESALSVQAMFPVTSGTEMAGQLGENSVADAAFRGDLAGPSGVWEQLAERLRNIPEYVEMFQAVYPEIRHALDISYTHAANAIAAYEASAFRCTNSPFDQYLNGEETALSEVQIEGMDLFYGEAGCVNCHSGKFQTDQDFHAIAMPQVGPGKGDNLEGYTDGRDDFGLERVTGDIADRFKFRTPSLRQVTLTGPYGHAGAYKDLEAVVRHHFDPVASLEAYRAFDATLQYRADLNALDDVAHNDPVRRAAIAAANELEPMSLADAEVSKLMAFLNALTDYSCLDYESQIPERVPSELPLCVGDLHATACQSFNPNWDIIRSVANLILWEPANSAISDMLISQREMDEALRLWQNNLPIPGTQDWMIDDLTMDTIITLWANQTVIPQRL